MIGDSVCLVEQTERLKDQAIGALIVTVVAVAYVAYFVYGQVPDYKLYVWVATVIAVNLYLVAWIISIHRSVITRANVKKFVIAYQIEAVVHGFSWGYLPFLLSQSTGMDTQLFAYYVICSMAAGAIATTGMIYRIYLSYMLPMMLPIVIDQILFTDIVIFSGNTSTISLFLIYIIAMSILSYRHYQSVMKSIVYSKRNDDLVRELRKEYQRAEEASHAKSRFLANMSHELRTPLNAVIGYSELIEEEAQESGAGRISDDAEKIRVSGKHLLKLIDDVLNLSRLDAGKLIVNYERINVGQMINAITPELNKEVALNNNSLEIFIEPGLEEFDSDIQMLERIIMSLISNSAKFTNNGKIKFTLEQRLHKTVPQICLQVVDTGIGMDEKQQEILFDAFRQADESSTRKYSGMGLGMAICQSFVKLLGGTIEVDSTPGTGTRIYICFPKAARVELNNAS